MVSRGSTGPGVETPVGQRMGGDESGPMQFSVSLATRLWPEPKLTKGVRVGRCRDVVGGKAGPWPSVEACASNATAHAAHARCGIRFCFASGVANALRYPQGGSCMTGRKEDAVRTDHSNEVMKRCCHYGSCNAPKCPLDLLYEERDRTQEGEEVCCARKSTRLRIVVQAIEDGVPAASQLKHGGLTRREAGAQERSRKAKARFAALPVAQQEKTRAAAIRQLVYARAVRKRKREGQPSLESMLGEPAGPTGTTPQQPPLCSPIDVAEDRHSHQMVPGLKPRAVGAPAAPA